MERKNNESYLENEYAEFWIENGVVCNSYKNNFSQLDLKSAKKMVNDRLIVSNNISRPLLVEVHKLMIADKEGRQYLAEGDALKCVTANAILVNNQITKFLGNIYIKFNAPKIPTKLFTDRMKAMKWLEQFKHLN